MKLIYLLGIILLTKNTTQRGNLCGLCFLKYFEAGDRHTVCGDNGVTYKNGCYAWCNKAKAIHPGACDVNNNPCGCGDGVQDYDPVCDFNGKSYNNSCIARCYGKDSASSEYCSLSALEDNRFNSHFPDVRGEPLGIELDPRELLNGNNES